MTNTRRALAYIRVSTDQQQASGLGLGLDAQRSAIQAEIQRRHWTVAGEYVDTASGASMARRPQLREALTLLADGGADVLIVSRLDRLSRSVTDAASVLERSRREGWSLVALDLGVDTSTPAGELTANVLSSAAQYERRLIGQRTKDALDAAKVRGVALGRPVTLPDHVVERIVAERSQRRTWASIATGLADDGIPTAQGGMWRPGTVQRIHARATR